MSTSPISRNKPGAAAPPKPAEESAPAGAVARATVTADGVRAEVAAAKGELSDGIDVEVFSSAAQVNEDGVSVEGAMARVQIRADQEGHRAQIETFSFKASAGRANPDGSTGVGLGLGANVVGIEGTVNLGGGTDVTGGLSAGAGAEASVGVRDFDKDNNPELCARVSLAFVTIGMCIENPF